MGDTIFKHRQRIAVHKLRLGVMSDGQKVFFDDWSETAMVMARKRDLNGYCGYWTVRFDDGGALGVHAERLRAA